MIADQAATIFLYLSPPGMKAEPGESHVALANSARVHRAVLRLVQASAGVSCR
jgi:hypothetical protein